MKSHIVVWETVVAPVEGCWNAGGPGVNELVAFTTTT